MLAIPISGSTPNVAFANGQTKAPCTWGASWQLVILLLLATTSAIGQSPPTEERARQRYTLAQTDCDNAPTNATAAWELGRAAYDLADFLLNSQELGAIAGAGVAACRKAVLLDPDSAPAHYYLALDLGQLARTKKLGALRLLHEMEHELLKAAKLDPTLDFAGPDRSLGMLYLEAPTWPASVGNRNKARLRLEAAVRLRPEHPENHISLAEAYAKWGESKNLERELKTLNELMPEARIRLAGDDWTASWKDWETRLKKLEKAEERLLANPRNLPADRGAKRN